MSPEGEASAQAATTNGRGTAGPSNPFSISAEAIGGILGAGAALAGWVAVVGGGRVWARLHAAEIPTTHTLAVLPRDLFLVEGLQTLLAPLLIGGVIAVLVYYSRRRADENPDVVRQREEERTEALQVERQRAAARRSEAAAEQLAWAAAAVGPPPPSEAGGVIDRAREQLTGARQQVTGARQQLTGGLWSLGPIAVAHRLGNRYTARTLLLIISASAAGLLALMLLIVGGEPWVLGVTVLVAFVVALGLQPHGLLIAVTVLILGALASLLYVVEPWSVVVMLVLTITAVWLTLGALQHDSPGRVALTLFAAFALWSGAVAFVRDIGERDPKLERVVVESELAPTRTGLYLGGGSGDVYIATEERPRTVTMIREEDVESLSFGGEVDVGSDVDETGNEREGGGGEPRPDSIPEQKPGPALAARQGMLDGIPVRLEITGLRRGQRLIVVDMRLINRSTDGEGIARTLTIGDLFDDHSPEHRGDDRDSLDGLQVTDLNRSRTRRAARDAEGRCVCSRGLSRVAVDPGGGAEDLFATFSRPPGDDPIHVLVPHFRTLVVEPQP